MGEAYLSDQDQNNKTQTQIGSVNTTNGMEWDFIQGTAVVLPRIAEADVGQTDGAPSEERRQTR